MELDDELKLRVATRLIDKSAAIWWDNLKLRTLTPIIWNLFVQEFNEQFYTQFHKDQKGKNSFDWDNLGRQSPSMSQNWKS